MLEKEIDHATAHLTDSLGYRPSLYRPAFGSMDDRSHAYLTEQGYTIVLWSAGCVDWWFTDNNISLDTSIAAMRYGLAEAGGIVCMHDKAEAPNDGERLRAFLDATWNFFEFVDFKTCTGHDEEGTSSSSHNGAPLLMTLLTVVSALACPFLFALV